MAVSVREEMLSRRCSRSDDNGKVGFGVVDQVRALTNPFSRDSLTWWARSFFLRPANKSKKNGCNYEEQAMTLERKTLDYRQASQTLPLVDLAWL